MRAWQLGRSSALCIVTLLASSVAHTTPLEDTIAKSQGTMWARTTPNFRDGRLVSCTLEYRVLTNDPIYRQGRLLLVDGSISLMVTGNNSGIGLKVVLRDIDGNTGEMLKTPAPTSAYFVNGYKTSKDALISAIPSDTPGGYFSLFKTSMTLKPLMEALERNELTIAFARRVGGTDVQFAVDPSVISTDEGGNRTHSAATVSTFLDCDKQLLEAAQAASKK